MAAKFQLKSLNITFITIITGDLAAVIIAALTRQTSKMVSGWYLMDPPSHPIVMLGLKATSPPAAHEN